MLKVDLVFEFAGVQIHPSFQLAQGEVMGLHGPSGIGKTTLLRTIAGLSIPTSGTIYWKDEQWNQGPVILVPTQLRQTGLMFQDYALFPNLSVEQNIRFSQKMGEQELIEMLQTFGVTDILTKSPDHLSGGQKQRVALARVLATLPDILLLDEPFSALDDLLKEQIKMYLRSYMNEYNTTTIIASHDHKDLQFFNSRQLSL